MVVAVRCPAPACRKYMLVEPADRGKVVPCLICRRGVPVPAGDAIPPAVPPAPAVAEAEALEPIFEPDPPPTPHARANDDDLLGLT